MTILILYAFMDFVYLGSLQPNSPDSYVIVWNYFQYFYIVYPQSYAFFKSPYDSLNQLILPFAFTVIASIVGPLKQILNMRFMLKEGQRRKLKLSSKENYGLMNESEINLEYLTKDRAKLLIPRRVLRSSQVCKRYRAVYEAFQKQSNSK